MQVLTVNGRRLLVQSIVTSEDGGTIAVTGAAVVPSEGSLDTSSVDGFLAAEQLGELESFNLSANHQTETRSLSEGEEAVLAASKLALAQSVKLAIPRRQVRDFLSR